MKIPLIIAALALVIPLGADRAEASTGGLTTASTGRLTATASTGRLTTATASAGGFTTVTITSSDGTALEANVIEPTTPGRHPAIVFISSWGLNDDEYLAQASALKDEGYVVLSYTTRGFWGSGGQIDTAGPKDIADVSSVLDWLTTHTTADPAEIGVGGVSYGAGIALIAAGFDARIKAVAAMSGWSDLVASLYGDQTRRPQAAFLLAAAARLTGRPSPELTAMLTDYFANQNVDAVKAWGRVRSAATYLSAINANHPAILMANAYGDSLFPPDQLVDFYGQLTGPKRLEFAPGDHAVVEATGLVGLDNHVWTSVHRWFDQYLSHVDSGIAGEPPVVLRVTTSGAVEQYANWAHVNTGTVHFGLSTTRTVWTGLDTTADAGVVLLSNGLAALTGVPPTDWLPSVSPINGAVWTTTQVGSIRGIPTLHVTLGNAPASGTLIAYLYDEDALGVGKLITHTPVTWLAPTTSLTARFPATAYDVPAGHRLALVVDTQDPLYLDANLPAQPITIAGSSWVDVPVR